MARINVYNYGDRDDPYREAPTLDGWFDDAKAEHVNEDTDWNGHNHISVHTGSQWDHESLYRTAKGRWILNRYSNRQGSQDTYEGITEERAREWLIRNNSDDLITKWFGQLEEESGPAVIGRPKQFDDPFPMRLAPDVQAEVDRRAQAEGVSRAEMIRRLVAAGIAGQGPQAHRLTGQE